MMSEADYYDVIIIGGGVSGLAAASKLLELGHENIIVLEASDRLGGRINTEETTDGIIEIGAQWIHGSEGNPVYDLLQSEDLVDESYHYWDENATVLAAYPNGTLQNEELSEEIFDAIESIFSSIIEELPNGTAEDQSVGELLDAALEESELLEKFDPVLVKALYKALLTDMRSDYACNSFHELNAVAVKKLSDVGYGGNNNVNLKNGYIKLIDHLASHIPESAIKLNEKVININWVGDVATVKVKSVIYDDVLSYRAKYVVSSLPLGVLKNNYFSIFSPPLPANKVNAIQKLSFGTVDKIFLVFDDAYFTGLSDLRLLWPEKHELNLKSSSNPGFYKNLSQFTVVPNRPNILVTLITGETAIYSESLSDQQLLEILIELLRNFYPHFNLTVPKLLRSKWNQNPLTQGSYTFIPTGSSVDDVYNLSKPVDNKLFFVGEATSIHIGTVHGAYETGIRAATVIDNLSE